MILNFDNILVILRIQTFLLIRKLSVFDNAKKNGNGYSSFKFASNYILREQSQESTKLVVFSFTETQFLNELLQEELETLNLFGPIDKYLVPFLRAVAPILNLNLPLATFDSPFQE